MKTLFIVSLVFLSGQFIQAQTFEILLNNKNFNKLTDIVEISDGFILATLEGELADFGLKPRIQKISFSGDLLGSFEIEHTAGDLPVKLTTINENITNVSFCYSENDSLRLISLNFDNNLTVLNQINVALNKQLFSPYSITLKSEMFSDNNIFLCIGLYSFTLPEESGFYFMKIDMELENSEYNYFPRNTTSYALVESVLSFPESDTVLVFAKRVFLTNETLQLIDSLPDNFYRFPHNEGEAAVFKPVKPHWYKNSLVIGGGRTYDIFRYDSNLSQDTFKIFTTDYNQLTSHYSPSSVFGDYIYLAGTNRFNLGNIYIDSYESYLRIFKVDSALNLRWQRDYNRYDGFYYFPLYTLATSDGGCLIAATRNNYNTMGEKADLYLLKVDSLGNYTPMVGLENPTTTTNTLVYPNPGTATLTIETAEGTTGSTFRMYNSTGTLMLQKLLQTETETIDVSNLPSGIYIYETQNHHGMVERGKWVKMD